jgi:hypothetical protein
MAHPAYSPKSALFAAFPKMKELSHEVNDVMEGAEETLSERELAGCDTSWARAHLFEAEWRINCTSDYAAAFDRHSSDSRWFEARIALSGVFGNGKSRVACAAGGRSSR